MTVIPEDSNGDPIWTFALPITLTANDGQTVSPSSFTTRDSQPTVSVTLDKADKLSLKASSGSIQGTSLAFLVSGGQPTSLTVKIPTTATAGVTFNVTITGVDAFGNPANGLIDVTSSDGEVTNGFTFLSNGQAVVPVTLDHTGTVSLSAVSSVSSTVTAKSGNVVVSPAALASLTVTTVSTVTAGSHLTATIFGKDKFGNFAGNGLVALTSSHGESIPSASLVNGKLIDPVRLTIAGTDKITVTYTAGNGSKITGVSAPFTVQAAALSIIAVGAPSSVPVGLAFNATFSATDAYGNPVGGTVALTSSDGQGVAPSTVTLSTGGTATAALTFMTADTTTLTATSETAAGTSGSIVVNLDWFYLHVSDRGIQQLARVDYNSNGKSLTYDDVYGLFLWATEVDTTVLNASEVGSLQALVFNGASSNVNMPAYVQFLAEKVLDGDPANATYQSLTSAGAVQILTLPNSSNIAAGEGSWMLLDLTKKWFLGYDYPSDGTPTNQLLGSVDVDKSSKSDES